MNFHDFQFSQATKSRIQHCARSEASYVYILRGQKSIKNAKKGSISASFWKPEPCGQKVLLDRSLSIRQKLVKIPKIKLRHFE